ncbi:alpha-amylase family glycosyl hydrolase [Sandaracinus amylolyticus]|uniref:alpha-amylase family glycosyl hydrolase n=1 Tax=Sandaracinus amylolyticus TaxID=927083 RepID=UPI001EEA0625|nr:alpha-amylase family glycosyl hydrolase [Sandaracinus amylolyticus]UJR86649.1 Hypothetical protein I5071_87500 [Sandaracinus amylolyticus]
MIDAHLARRALLAALAVLAGACGGEAPPAVPDAGVPRHRANTDVDWRDQVVYQILVDRFENGDPTNDVNVDRTRGARYHGGDWRGVIERLDYIEALGATAIWISPVVENVELHVDAAGYHGYSASDFTRPNPHFGDLATLRELVDEAHRRGILVVLDIVTNHIGQLFYYDVDDDGSPSSEIPGAGVAHTCTRVCEAGACTADELAYCRSAGESLDTVNEWDPLYDPRGVRAMGRPDALTEVEFLDWPDMNRRAPPRPPPELDWPDDLPWFDESSWYHRRGRIPPFFPGGELSRRFVREAETYSDFGGGLWGLDTDQPIVQEALFRVYAHWVEVADFDGFRIDTVKHVDRPDLDPDVRGFWGDFAPRMRAHAASLGKSSFFMFGEAFDGDDTLVGAYTRPGTDARGGFARLDSMLHFSNKWRVFDEVVRDGGPTRNVECVLAARRGAAEEIEWCRGRGFATGATYHTRSVASRERGGTGVAPSEQLVTFIDNHDVPRFLSTGASVESLHAALFHLLTWDGVPCLYYGTEQLFDGGADPANREDMWDGNPARGLAPFDTENPTFEHVRSLIALRRAHPALRRGRTTIRWATDRERGASDHGLLAFERETTDETLLVVLNTAADQTSTTCTTPSTPSTCMRTSFAPGTQLRDIAPGARDSTHRVGEGGTLMLTVPARRGMIFARVGGEDEP